MKKIIILILCSVVLDCAYAQPNCPSPFGGKWAKSRGNAINRYQVGAGLGFTNLKGDRKDARAWGIGGYLNVDYQIIEGLFVGIRGQYGSLKMNATHSDARALDSRYFGFGGGVRLHPFDLFAATDARDMEVSMAKGLLHAFYVGADVLHLTNKFSTIYRGNPVNNNAYGPVDHYDTNGKPVFKEKTNSLMLPSLNIGLAPIINRSSTNQLLRLVLNAQFNFANNDLLDGYTPIDANMNRVNTENDSYSFYSLGLSYSF